MSLSNESETAFLELLLNNAAWANIGDAAGLQPSAADGNLYVSLHTADPGEAGTQATSETAYTSYARVAVSRAGTAWTVVANIAENAAGVSFPACTGGTSTVTHFGIGTAASGAGHLVLSGELDDPLAVSSGITPQFSAGELTVTAD